MSHQQQDRARRRERKMEQRAERRQRAMRHHHLATTLRGRVSDLLFEMRVVEAELATHATLNERWS